MHFGRILTIPLLCCLVGSTAVAQPSSNSKLPGIDARDFGVEARDPDATAKAQAALDAAYKAGFGATVYFPTSFNFTRLVTYPNIKIMCGGPMHPLHRIAPGPGVVLADKPGNSYAASFVPGAKIEDCTIDGGRNAGTNLMIDAAESWQLINVNSTNSGSGAQFTGTIDGTKLTVSAVNRGRLGVGQMLLCAGCSLTGNTHPTIKSLGSGSGGSGTYVLSAAPAAGPVASAPMLAVDSWTWTDAGGSHTLPSANATFMGGKADGVFDGQWIGGFVGGTYTPPNNSGCDHTAAIGILLDSTTPDGTNKPNHNLFENIYAPCNYAGFVLNNGADNSIIHIDYEFDLVAQIFGLGAANAFRNIVTQPYFEGLESSPTAVAMIFDHNAQDNTVIGTGSMNFVTRPLLDNGGHNVVKLNNDQTYNGSSVIDTWYHGATLLNSPPPRIGPSRIYNGDDGRPLELAVLTHGGDGNISCGFTSGSNASPGKVLTGDIICNFGGWGQYDASAGHYSGLAAGIQIAATGDWSQTSWPANLLFSTTPIGSTTKILRFSLGEGLYANGLRDPGPGGVNATALQLNGVAIGPALSGTTGLIGGSPLSAGQCASGSANIAKAAPYTAIAVSPNTYPGDGAMWQAHIAAPGTVTVKVCAIVAMTPTPSTYNVRVIH